MMKIRPHHLWLIRGIIEENGSISHISFDPLISKEQRLQIQKKLKNIYQIIINNPSLQINIIDSLDDICEFCPNSNGMKCTRYPRLDDVDIEALKQYGLKFNEAYYSRDILRKLKSN